MSIISLFRPPSAADLKRQDLVEAERQAHQHEMAAEHHACLAKMYAERVSRLRQEASEYQKSVP